MDPIIINRTFTTRPQKDARVLEVAETFGLGLSDKKFTVYDQLKVNIKQGDIVYITGQSGSGKSLALRDIAAELERRGLKVANIDKIEMRDCALVSQIGHDTQDALNLMNQAGLNDAYLWVRAPAELSDGQKYRFKLAKVIASGAHVWVADEFGAVLDRETAKIVAFNLSKAARKAGAILIVATTHGDLVDYLAPTLTIEKLFGERVDISRDLWVKAGEPINPIDPEKAAQLQTLLDEHLARSRQLEEFVRQALAQEVKPQ
jgi:ABC-type ATPase with predicted acetyltransferase domain